MPSTVIDLDTTYTANISCYPETYNYLITGMSDTDKYQCCIFNPMDESIFDYIVLISYVFAVLFCAGCLLYNRLMVNNDSDEFDPSSGDDSEPDSISDSIRPVSDIAKNFSRTNSVR